MYAFYRAAFQKCSIFPNDQKLNQAFISKRVGTTFRHSAKQSVEILKSSEETKSWVKCLKNLATCLSYVTCGWVTCLTQFLLVALLFFVAIFCVFMSNYYTCNMESANVNLKKVDTIIVYGNTWLGNTIIIFVI